MMMKTNTENIGIMKYRLLNILGLIAILAMVTSCKKEFLDTPSPAPTYEINFSSAENAELAVVGCYDIMGWDGQHNTIPFFFGDIVGRDTWKGGDVGGNQDWMNNLINFTYTTDNYMLNTAYTDYFKGVGRANSTIENVDKMKPELISDALKAQYIAEAKFTRAYFYFELVKTFGSIPLIDHILTPDEYQQPLASENAIYDFIESDLKAAAAALPTKSAAGADYVGRATKGMAQALLAKAYVYRKKWPEAKKITDEIIASNEYALLNNFADVFDMNNENNDEIIFSIQFMESANGEYGNDNEGSMLEVYLTARNAPFAGIGGWGFSCPTKDLYDEFEAGDKRRDLSIISDGDTLWKGTPDEQVFHLNFATNKDHFANRKYALPHSQQPSEMSDASKNWIVIRYADVLLWNAEAAFNAGGDWNTPLMQVRTRAGLGAPTLTGLDAIYHERRVELALEGQRFWDVVRQGRGDAVLGADGFIEGVHNHFPIPQAQLDLSDLW
jgi:hypothetical protein